MIKESISVQVDTIHEKLKKLGDAENGLEIEIWRVWESHSKLNQVGRQSIAIDH